MGLCQDPIGTCFDLDVDVGSFGVAQGVVLDVRLPDGSGVEACRDILSRFPDIKVLMLTSFADEEALMAAILAGASGYVLKTLTGGPAVTVGFGILAAIHFWLASAL